MWWGDELTKNFSFRILAWHAQEQYVSMAVRQTFSICYSHIPFVESAKIFIFAFFKLGMRLISCLSLLWSEFLVNKVHYISKRRRRRSHILNMHLTNICNRIFFNVHFLRQLQIHSLKQCYKPTTNYAPFTTCLAWNGPLHSPWKRKLGPRNCHEKENCVTQVKKRGTSRERTSAACLITTMLLMLWRSGIRRLRITSTIPQGLVWIQVILPR